MHDGERRVIKKQGFQEDIGVEVIAFQWDSETPYVILKKGEAEWHFADVDAEELIKRIAKALMILPTSK